ncbi:phosphopantetheine-binding protein [Streptomyces sp. AM 2-1-1]|uniref:phosphopantetheine-binding protein n=1 Tax=Streptomyces sp. AM 2-1-1 TaxID=3028709 RepID=UPI0023B89539|nr:phosphopantetheine-binding protein [Streptomyces sp. AM 2-1-1]WEH43438.1 phosphopantetheine-binding protein [Streptomyces sp. AM 2-1-1]
MTVPAPSRIPSLQGLAGLVERATDGRLAAADIVDSPASLAALGVSSLALLRLADSLEAEYGVLVDLGDRTLYTEGLAGLTARVRNLVAEGTP